MGTIRNKVNYLKIIIQTCIHAKIIIFFRFSLMGIEQDLSVIPLNSLGWYILDWDEKGRRISYKVRKDLLRKNIIKHYMHYYHFIFTTADIPCPFVTDESNFLFITVLMILHSF